MKRPAKKALKTITPPLMQRQETMKLASDHWYPCFSDSQVRVSFMELYPSRDYRVCVWGADDSGRVRDFPPAEKDQAEALYQFLLSATFINHALCVSKGMDHA